MVNKINNILLPTDFGELGEFAYTMAKHIADKSKASIHVISVVPGPQDAFYSNSGQLLNFEGNDYTEWDKKLAISKEKMKTWISDKTHISDTLSVIGKVDDSILLYANNHDIDLIVMGTDGVFGSRFWNKPSHAEFITNHSTIPVLTLKCDRTNIHLEEIVFVGDFLEAKEMNLDITKSIQTVFNSKLLLLKIHTPHDNRSNDQIIKDIEAYAKVNKLSNYEIHIYEDKIIESGIGKFTAEKDIDLIILGTHQGKGFSKLFHKNISDDIVNHLFHPILTFPID